MAATFGDFVSLTDACMAAGVDPSGWDAAGRQGEALALSSSRRADDKLP